MKRLIMLLMAFALLAGCTVKGPVTDNDYRVTHDADGLKIKKVD